LALKYHPKHNLGSDAETKFKDVAKAYETIIENKNQRDNS
jgi:DnaJ-class molecular chaperone